MPLESQFSLSVELSRFVPFSPLASLASHALLDLIRDFRSSGSDLVTEVDLAAILGRCIIPKQFSDTFKNVLRTSPVQKLAGLVEIVLQNTGPSITQGANNVEFFCMIVQVSLLVHCHELQSLATSLARIFEVRNAERPRGNVSRYDALLSTLSSLREQTAAYPWDRLYKAFDSEFLEFSTGSSIDGRQIPHVILGALFDALVAVQRLPEAHFLEIRTTSGLSTLAIWTHNVLGLDISISNSFHTRRLGRGTPTVSLVQLDRYGLESEVILYKVTDDTKEVWFRACQDAMNDPVLEPQQHHPIEGLGTSWMKSKGYWDEERAPKIISHILRECIQAAEAQAHSPKVSIVSRLIPPPTRSKLMIVTQILFPSLNLLEATWTEDDWVSSLQWRSYRELILIIIALARVENVEAVKDAPLHLRAFELAAYESVSILNDHKFIMNAEEAFETLALLLLNDVRAPVSTAAVVSNCGWSLCLSSVFSIDPGMMKQGVYLLPGVPTRDMERRHLVLDSPSAVDDNPYGVVRGTHDVTDGNYYVVQAAPEEKADFSAYLVPEPEKRMIATTDKAFRVILTFEATDGKDNKALFRTGFRYMQNLFWSTPNMPLDDCEHGFSHTTRYPLDSSSWVFNGYLSSPTEPLPSERLCELRDPWSTTGQYWQSPNTSLFRDLRKDDGYRQQAEPAGQIAETRTGHPSQHDEQAERPIKERVEDHEDQESPHAMNSLVPGTFCHISRSAGCRALRWLLLSFGTQLSDKSWRQRRGLAATMAYGAYFRWLPRFSAVYIRRGQCCPNCAVAYIRGLPLADQERQAHVLLIT